MSVVNVVLYFQVGGMPPNRLPLVVDAENCLDRLYGGFYSGYNSFNLLFIIKCQILYQGLEDMSCKYNQIDFHLIGKMLC